MSVVRHVEDEIVGKDKGQGSTEDQGHVSVFVQKKILSIEEGNGTRRSPERIGAKEVLKDANGHDE